jgi:hypothetical protein
MHELHPEFESPETATTIWRYLDLVKLADLLDSQTLYFSRIDKLEDPWEGHYPKAAVDAAKEAAKLHNIPAEKVLYFLEFHKGFNATVFVNCWHLNNHESIAMWKQYSKDGEGIAIKSSMGRLREAIEAVPDKIMIGKVKYIDYYNDSIPAQNALLPYLRKRKSFEHETELRALIWKFPEADSKNPDGLHIKVNAVKLIEAIHISPGMPTWKADVIKKVLKKYNFPESIVINSAIDNKPLY